MEHLTIIQGQTTSLTQIVSSKELLLNKIVKEKGINPINALDLFDIPIDEQVRRYVKMALTVNYRLEPGANEYNYDLLFSQIEQAGWNAIRLKTTLDYFLQNKLYSTWTVADWFQYKQTLYPYSWYMDMIQKHGKNINKELVSYKINGFMYYCKKGDITIDLPYEKIDLAEYEDIQKLKNKYRLTLGTEPKDINKMIELYRKYGYDYVSDMIRG